MNIIYGNTSCTWIFPLVVLCLFWKVSRLGEYEWGKCEYFFLNKQHPNIMLRSTTELSITSGWFQGLNCCKNIKYSVQFCTSAMGVCVDSLTTIMGRKNRATTRYDENNSRFMFYSELDWGRLGPGPGLHCYIYLSTLWQKDLEYLTASTHTICHKITLLMNNILYSLLGMALSRDWHQGLKTFTFLSWSRIRS